MLTWPEDRRSAKRKRREDGKSVAIPWQTDLPILTQLPVRNSLGKLAAGDLSSQTLAVEREIVGEEDTDIEEITRDDIGQHTQQRNDPHKWLPPVNSTARMLFSYCKSAPVDMHSMY